jgi:hypothetical protein
MLQQHRDAYRAQLLDAFKLIRESFTVKGVFSTATP